MSAREAERLARPDSRPPRTIPFAIALITVATGAAEIVAPGPMLMLLGAEDTALARQLFGTVGMFMLVVGALLAHTLARAMPDHDVVFWACVQKAGASVAVSIGVLNATFTPLALAVVFFDLASAFLLALYRRLLRRQGATRQ